MKRQDKNNLILKVILFALVNAFYFFIVTIPVLAADSSLPGCYLKYPTQAQCAEAKACPELMTEDKTAGLCPTGQKCCHEQTGAAAAPQVQLQVPIFSYVKATDFAEYIATIYQYALYILVPIAIIVIIYAGISWITAAGDIPKIKRAKDYIINAFLGVTIALLSYVILSIFGLDTLKSLSLQYIETLPIDEPDYLTEENVTSTGKTIATKGQDCFYDTFGHTAAEVNAQLVSVPCPNLKAGTVLRVHKLAAPAYREVCAKIPPGNHTLVCGKPLFVEGTYCWRGINTGHGISTTSRSPHSYGIAVDISPWGCKAQGYCDNAPRSSGCCKNYLPAEVVNAFKSVDGFRWGGDFKRKCDYMHFEWIKPCIK